MLNISVLYLEKVLEKYPMFLQSDGTDDVHGSTVSSVSWSFPELELNANELQAWIGSLMQEYGTKLFGYKGVLAVKGCREKFVRQSVHVSLSGGFVSDVMSGSDTARDTWQDGEGRECRIVSIDKEEMTQNAENFKHDFLLYVAEETLRFKVGDQVLARVGG